MLGVAEVPDYRVVVAYDGAPHVYDDPYRFLPTLGEVDLHLINEGRHEQLWTVLGARVHRYDAAAPSPARRSRCGRPSARGGAAQGRLQPAGTAASTRCASSAAPGVWELFVPDVGNGTAYKFAILGADGAVAREGRPDGLLRRACRRPRRRWSSSRSYTWGDDDVDDRARRQAAGRTRRCRSTRCTSASWRRGTRPTPSSPTSWSPYLADLGFTHVELMPVMQHPFGGSWGYHVTSYFAPDSRFGDPDGFRLLVDRLHQAGIGVILDWVPGHFATDEWALARFDGTPLYEDPNPQRGWHQEWGSHIFNFGRREVRNFLVRQRALLARGVPRRRPARRRRRLDALPRLLPRGGRVDARTCTAAARTSRPCSSSRR